MTPEITSAADELYLEARTDKLRLNQSFIVSVNGTQFEYSCEADAQAVFNRLETGLKALCNAGEAAMPPLPKEWRERMEKDGNELVAERRAKVSHQLKTLVSTVKKLDVKRRNAKSGSAGGSKPKRTPLRTLLLEAFQRLRAEGLTLKEALASLEESSFKSLRLSYDKPSDGWRIEDEDAVDQCFELLTLEQLKDLFKRAGVNLGK